MPGDVLRRSANPRDAAFYQEPASWYRELHAAGSRPFFWEEYGFWCVPGFDEANAVLRDKRLGLGPGLRPRSDRIRNWWEVERWSLLAIDPPDHTRLRGLTNRAFVSRRIEALRPSIAALADELIDRFHGTGSVELLGAYAAPLPAIVIAELIGLPAEMAPQLLSWSNTMVQMYMFGADPTVESAADRAAADFAAYLRIVIDERRRAPAPDLLSHLLEVHDDGVVLADDEVVATAILLLNAGHEATVHTTGNAAATILRSGIELQRMFETPAQTAATVEECLRFEAPLHMFTRYALEDVEPAPGLRLHKGEQVGVMLGAANRDPRRFARPDEFDPFRADGGNVSFGAGLHFCVAAPLARLELQIALRTLFERIPEARLSASPVYRDIYHFHGLDAVSLEW